jgi:hypothetical protein
MPPQPRPWSDRARVLLVGLGDLGQRLTALCCTLPEIGQLIIAGRRAHVGAPFAALMASCGTSLVRFVEVNAARVDDLVTLLKRERPALVINCASLLSPWLLHERDDPRAVALRAAGFAVQVPAHLPLLRNLMRAVRETGLDDTPVVNVSYPDATHAVLAGSSLMPTIGLGNAAMIRSQVMATLRRTSTDTGAEEALVRVLAHHAHVTPVVRATPPDGIPAPRIYLGETGVRMDAIAFSGPPLPSTRELNALTAASAAAILRALLDSTSCVRTSAPGVHGLPGGWPVRIAEGRVMLDLPSGLTRDDGLVFHRTSGRGDGIEAIDEHGTIHFTEAACAALAPHDPGLTEPIELRDIDRRWTRLRQLIDRP